MKKAQTSLATGGTMDNVGRDKKHNMRQGMNKLFEQ